MRAREFIQESRNTDRPEGEIHDHHYMANPGAITSTSMDRYYDMYRAGMLMGRAPADLNNLDAASWMNNRAYFGAYTDVEKEKVKQALKKLGVKSEEIIPSGSEEPDDTHSTSPVKPFKGYPRFGYRG